MGVEDDIRREAMNYESKGDTVKRMGAGLPPPMAKRYKAPTSPILWAGRVIFGLLTVGCLVAALYGKFHSIEQDDAMVRGGGAGIILFGAMFLLTFVKRAF